MSGTKIIEGLRQAVAGDFYDNRNDWREYYVDEFTAEDAADEDVTYWGD